MSLHPIPRTRKAQAAMDFLMTYGWAILIMLFVAGILLYFNFFDIRGSTGPTCSFSQRLKCRDFLIAEQGQDAAKSAVLIEIQNNNEVPILISAARGQRGELVQAPPSCTPIWLGVGRSANLSCDLDPRIAPGEWVSVNVVLTYSQNESAAPTHELTGTVSGLSTCGRVTVATQTGPDDTENIPIFDDSAC